MKPFSRLRGTSNGQSSQPIARGLPFSPYWGTSSGNRSQTERISSTLRTRTLLAPSGSFLERAALLFEMGDGGNRHPWPAPRPTPHALAPRPAQSFAPPPRQLFFSALGSPLPLFRRFPTGQEQVPHCWECSQPTLGSSCPVIHIFCGKGHNQLVHADCLESYTERLEKKCLASSNRWAAARRPRFPPAPAPPAACPRTTALTTSRLLSCIAARHAQQAREAHPEGAAEQG